jgi:hypothetical protein
VEVDVAKQTPESARVVIAEEQRSGGVTSGGTTFLQVSIRLRSKQKKNVRPSIVSHETDGSVVAENS